MIMQKDNVNNQKISIFNFTKSSRVELIKFSVESSQVKLRNKVIQLKSNRESSQIKNKLSRVKNVNLKLDLTINLLL